MQGRIDRGELARALDDVARADRRLAQALTTCEAWQSGYCAEVVNLAADLSMQDDPSLQACGSHRERSLQAMQRALDIMNPRYHARGLVEPPPAAAVQAMLALLTAQARFHEAAMGVDRRRSHRTAPAH